MSNAGLAMMNYLFGQWEASWYPYSLSKGVEFILRTASLMNKLLIGDFLGIGSGKFLSMSHGEVARRPPTRIRLLSSSKKGEKLREFLFPLTIFPLPISLISAR